MKKWIFIAVAMILAGTVICFATAAAMHFDLGKLDTGKYKTNSYSVDESFRDISVTVSTEKVFFKPAENGKCTIICFEEEDSTHVVSVIDRTLTITKPAEDRKLSHHFGVSTLSPEITVYLPESTYSDLRIETDTGDVDIPADFAFDSITINGDTSDVACLASSNDGIEIALSSGDLSISAVKAGEIELKTTTGGISAQSVNCVGDVHIQVDTGLAKLQNVTCRNLTSEGTTGDLTLDHVVADETLSITRDAGNVEFLESDAASIYVRTDTGDVTGTLLTEKMFITETDTGKVDVPKSTTGGRCEISTNTGDIRIETR